MVPIDCGANSTLATLDTEFAVPIWDVRTTLPTITTARRTALSQLSNCSAFLDDNACTCPLRRNVSGLLSVIREPGGNTVGDVVHCGLLL